MGTIRQAFQTRPIIFLLAGGNPQRSEVKLERSVASNSLTTELQYSPQPIEN